MKTLIVAVATLTIAGVQAQNSRSSKTAFIENPNAVVYSLPRTAIKVGIVVEKETIRKGPYARFAQRYLGVVAPLADKDLYTIKGASLGYFEESDPEKVYSVDANDKALAALVKNNGDVLIANKQAVLRNRFGVSKQDDTFTFNDLGIAPIVSERQVVSHVQGDSSFVQVQADRTETEEKSLEQMAADAAKTIFTLRKRRFDLITGEAGENVFGAGLDAAIREMNRMEQEYLSLFLGKIAVQQIVREYEIIPDSTKTTYIVCRFSETEGLLADNDLSGKPVLLEVKPEGRAASYAIPKKQTKDPRPVIWYRVADVTMCRVLDGKRELTRDRVPVYQMGTIVDVPLNVAK